jgi:hypothetical protein
VNEIRNRRVAFSGGLAGRMGVSGCGGPGRALGQEMTCRNGSLAERDGNVSYCINKNRNSYYV